MLYLDLNNLIITDCTDQNFDIRLLKLHMLTFDQFYVLNIHLHIELSYFCLLITLNCDLFVFHSDLEDEDLGYFDLDEFIPSSNPESPISKDCEQSKTSSLIEVHHKVNLQDGWYFLVKFIIHMKTLNKITFLVQ